MDCTEIFIQRPSSLNHQSSIFSYYKNHNTVKALVGISPGGVITFVSQLWGGRVSDIELTKRSGLLELIEEGNNVMADRGFEIVGLLASRKATLNIPPFLGSGKQFTMHETIETRRIAQLCIPVERAIVRAKQFRMLQGILPIKLANVASDVFTICLLTNFLLPIISSNGKYIAEEDYILTCSLYDAIII